MKLTQLQEAKYHSGSIMDWVIQAVNKTEREHQQHVEPIKQELTDKQYKDALRQLTKSLGKPKRGISVIQDEWHWHLFADDTSVKQYNYMIRLTYHSSYTSPLSGAQHQRSPTIWVEAYSKP